MADTKDIIDRAFADTEYPGDDDLTGYPKEGREYDDTWKLLRGKDWRDMPVYEFMSGDTPIPDLTPRAFHYYLPALLKASLTEGPSQCVLDSLPFYLNPKSAHSDDPRYGYDCRTEHEQFRSLLSRPQRDAVMTTIDEWHAQGWLDDAEYQELRNAYSHQTEPNTGGIGGQAGIGQ